MPFTHYIVVRRDLEFGEVLAQVAHAAGESFYLFAGSSAQSAEKSEVGGSMPSPRANFNPHETIVVVLGARNELRLLKLEKSLLEFAVGHVAVRETEGAHAGHLMAIGLIPTRKEAVEAYLNEFHMFPAIGSACSTNG